MNVFDEVTLRKLERLTLVAEHVRIGRIKGDRRSRKRGSSIEFADFRDYTKGDDLRRLDWNVYARLDRPFLKLLEEEEDLAIHLLVDSSASMNWPDGEASDQNKLTYALRLAASLGYIGLLTNDLVQVAILNSEANRNWGPYRGRPNSMRLFQFLETVTGSGTTNLNFSLRDYALRGRRAGLLFLISDLLSPSGYKEGLNALLARGYEVGLLHLLSPDEVSPQFAGDLRLVDIETGQDTEISLDLPTANLYRQRLEAWQEEIATHCHGLRIHYVPVVTNISWEKLVMQELPLKGILK
jgi:uncharacterized protein (DUF58 family)